MTTIDAALLPPAETAPGTCRRCGLSTRLYAYIHLLTGHWPACINGHDDHEPETP